VCLWDTATGALKQTLSVSGSITYLQFARDGSYLVTNLGSLDIQLGHDSNASKLSVVDLEIRVEQGQWIKLNGKNILWLPPEFRPRCSAVHEFIGPRKRNSTGFFYRIRV
jgi:hypothetical protein